MIEGFFTKKEVESKTRPDGKVYSCHSCRLHKECISSKMKPYGQFKKGILNIGEAPGEVEDKVGRPWQGKTGKLLQRTYEELGIDLFDDCLNVNAVNCRPTDSKGYNRAPIAYEVECCRRIVLNIIEEYKPRVIILLGNQAIYSLIGHRWKKDLGGVTKWRGWTIPDQDYNAWLCPTFHPSYIERSLTSSIGNKKRTSAEERVWKQDLQQAFDLLQKNTYQGKTTYAHPFPIHKEPTIEIIDNLSILDKIKSGEVAFDYETTGLKSHDESHEIVCCSVAISPDYVYVFMIPKTRKERKPLIRLLTDPNVGKIAANMKFEHAWSKSKLGIEVTPWVWDTMIASHVLDNRSGICGLKFQAYVRFGIVDYSSDIAPFFQSIEDSNANSRNKIFDLLKKPGGKKKLLTYCGYDSIYEYRLAEIQRMNLLPF